MILNYCPDCGSSLGSKSVEGRDRAYCSMCERVIYRNPKPCAGVIVTKGDQILLVKRTQPPGEGTWSVPAGYLEYDERPEEAAVRELREETNVVVSPKKIDLFGTKFVQHQDCTNVLVILYQVVRHATQGQPKAGSDADGAEFWELSRLEKLGEEIEPGYRTIFERVVQS